MKQTLGSIIEEIFRSKGYEVSRSSPENQFLLLARDDEVLAIGYTGLSMAATAGEVEMFHSMVLSEGASSSVFISPVPLPRETLKALKDNGINIWDRTALVLAIGETALKNAMEAKDEADIETWDDAPSAPVPEAEELPDIDPVHELRKFEEGLRSDGFKHRKVVPASEPDRKDAPATEGRKARQRNYPDSEVAKVPRPGQEADMYIADSAGPIQLLSTPAPEPTASVAPSDVRSFAPLRISREDALEMAPGAVSDLELVYRPYLVLEVSYRLRTSDGKIESSRRTNVMIDMVDGSVFDAPATVLDDLMGDPGPRDTPVSEESAVLDGEKARKVALDSLRMRGHAVERTVYDGMMSTIIREEPADISEGSLSVQREKGVMMPLWSGHLRFGRMPWTMDAYAGTQRRDR